MDECWFRWLVRASVADGSPPGCRWGIDRNAPYGAIARRIGSRTSAYVTVVPGGTAISACHLGISSQLKTMVRPR
jgi:hypothetical protein